MSIKQFPIIVFALMWMAIVFAFCTQTAFAQVSCTTGTQTSGALYQLCEPAAGTNTLVLYAHGYVAPEQPLALPAESAQLGGFANLQGYAFATTSYSRNGLAIQEGMADLLDLIDVYAAAHGAPERVFLIGFSEGGIITALAVEQNPDRFAAGLSMCGPIGSFLAQTNYFGDGRVLFDYYFPGLMPGTATDIPATLQTDWETFFADTITPVLTDPANAATVDEYLAVSGVPFDAAAPATKFASIQQVLWYNVFSTNDATDLFGGTPYDNSERVYSGSADDAALNAAVPRYTSTVTTTAYETSGQLAVPLVTMHTSGDPVIPDFHNAIYADKIAASGSDVLHTHIPIDAYGHCNFTQFEVIAAFSQMVALADAQPSAVQLVSSQALHSNWQIVLLLAGFAVCMSGGCWCWKR